MCGSCENNNLKSLRGRAPTFSRQITFDPNTRFAVEENNSEEMWTPRTKKPLETNKENVATPGSASNKRQKLTSDSSNGASILRPVIMNIEDGGSKLADNLFQL